MGKGSAPRKSANQEAYASNWDKIFRKKPAFDLISDCHIEFDMKNLVVTSKSDTLVIAGDMFAVEYAFQKNTTLWECMASLAKKYAHVLWVFGNHEYYDGTFDTLKEKTETWLKKMGVFNVYVLQNDTFETENILFFGATLWTDCDNANPVTMQRIGGAMNDFSCIRKLRDAPTSAGYLSDRFKVMDAVADHSNTVTKVKEFIQLKTDKPKVCIFHHAPSYASVHEQYRGDLINAGYASDLFNVFFESGIHTIVHGHMHNRVDYMLDKTRVVTNPRGYFGARGTHNPHWEGYDSLLIEC